MVVAEHVLPWWLLQGSAVGDALSLALSMGWVGVELFFVLSGFLITGILLRTREEPTYYRTFGLRRALRILPVYALLLGFVFLALPVWEPTGDPRIDHPDAASLWVYLSFGTNLFPFLGFEPHRFLLLTWSLALEQQFYLFWPFFCRWLKARSVLVLSLVILIASPFLRVLLREGFGVDAGALYYGGVTHLDGLAVGAAIAAAMQSKDGLAARVLDLLRRHLLLLGLATLAVTLLNAASDAETDICFRLPMQASGYTLYSLFFGSLLVRLVEKRRHAAAGFFTSSPMIGAGRISYSLYLFHIPFAILLTRFADGQAPGPAPLIPYEVAFGGIAVSVVAAAVIYATLEQWCIRLGQRVTS